MNGYITYDKKWKTLWQKEKLHVLCNFFFCHYVFKKLSAAEASESVYMRERVNNSDGDYFEIQFVGNGEHANNDGLN